MADEAFFAREKTSLTALSPQSENLFGTNSVFCTLGWYRSTLAHALPDAAQAVFIEIGSGEEVLALFPMQRGPGSAFSALTTPYTCLWQPLFAESVGQDAAVLQRIGQAFARACRKHSTIRLDALDAEAAWLPPLLNGIRTGGLVPLRFAHFGNWFERLAAPDWQDYLAARPGALRESIRRRTRKLLNDMGATLTIATARENLEPAIAAYEKIYDASWKEPEPYPLFNAAFMREACLDGSLRLGILSLAEKPVAAQFWVVHGHCATVLKLAHDETSRALSPGTVLTGLMIRHILKNEPIHTLDFGRGDDDYKKDWVNQRRQRIGILVANPASMRGAAAIVQHWAGEIKGGTRRGVGRFEFQRFGRSGRSALKR